MHSCPDCGQACCCDGDVDDIMWDDDSEECMGCSHSCEVLDGDEECYD